MSWRYPRRANRRKWWITVIVVQKTVWHHRRPCTTRFANVPGSRTFRPLWHDLDAAAIPSLGHHIVFLDANHLRCSGARPGFGRTRRSFLKTH